jgi:hypothetical protein
MHAVSSRTLLLQRRVYRLAMHWRRVARQRSSTRRSRTYAPKAVFQSQPSTRLPALAPLPVTVPGGYSLPAEKFDTAVSSTEGHQSRQAVPPIVLPQPGHRAQPRRPEFILADSRQQDTFSATDPEHDLFTRGTEDAVQRLKYLVAEYQALSADRERIAAGSFLFRLDICASHRACPADPEHAGEREVDHRLQALREHMATVLAEVKRGIVPSS